MPPEPTESDATSPECRRQFWLVVGAFDVALLATALGALVLVFWSRPTLGVGFVVVGVGASVSGLLRFR